MPRPRPGGPHPLQKSRPLRVARALALTVVLSLSTQPAAAHEAHTERAAVAETTGHRLTVTQIRWCRMVGTGARFVACLHAAGGHHQGQPGHLWADYQVQARQLRRYLAGINPTCSGPGDCPRLIRLAFDRMGVGWRGHEAVRVATCESGLNPRAYNASSGASSLFQQLARYWPARAVTYGMAGRSVFDPWANAVVSAGMVRDTGGWSHWTCRP